MESKVRFVDEKLKEAFEQTKEVDPRLYKELERAFNSITSDAFFGRRVKKELIPKELIKKYSLTNLFIYNLSSSWRLIYSLVNEEVEVIAVVLDWMNHKDYERIFGF